MLHCEPPLKVWGINSESGERTICGNTVIADGNWHHIAVQRRFIDGEMSIYVDGVLDAQGDGPEGDISYPDDGMPGDFCNGQACTQSDPFIVIGAEKHDAGADFPSYSGLFDELRISSSVRYTDNFTRPSTPFVNDEDTVGLYHLDESGDSSTVRDSATPLRGPAHGELRYGGNPPGPVWVGSSIETNTQ